MASSLDREFLRLCSLNSVLTKKLCQAEPEERAAVRAEIEANRKKMRDYGKRAAPFRQQRRKDYASEAEEAEREARRRKEGYW